MSSQQPLQTAGCASDAVIDWIFSVGRRIESTNKFVHQLAHQLNDHGASIDRLLLSLLTLNPQLIGTSETWLKSTDTTTPVNASHGVRDTDRFIGSPLQAIYETHKRVRRRLDNLPEDAHRAYTELAEDGFTDYLALPVLFGEVAQPGAAIIICTKQEGGFSAQEIESFRQIRDYLAPVLEVHALRHISRSLMNTYVGKRTSEKVLAGMVKRGDADVINAALWYSDLRHFTHLTETMPAQQILEMLNEYFEFVSAAVTARGGEILRFIGDAMLIVFPIDDNMCAQSACNAHAGESQPSAPPARPADDRIRRRTECRRSYLRQCRCAGPTRLYRHGSRGQPYRAPGITDQGTGLRHPVLREILRIDRNAFGVSRQS
jgi:adenylate cyclase